MDSNQTRFFHLWCYCFIVSALATIYRHFRRYLAKRFNYYWFGRLNCFRDGKSPYR